MFNFWQKLKKPFFALAPMADVTDFAFREMFARHGKPDVMFTEFVSVEGLCSAGRENLTRELKYSEKQRPIVAQLWGTRPENFLKAADMVKKMGFDGIDINMGCPQRKEVAVGGCAALIKNPGLAAEIIASAKKGAGVLPVSVKTRIGYDKIETGRWIKTLLGCDPAAIIVHGRTRKEMSKVPAHWDEIGKAVKLRDKLRSSALIVGNGDVASISDAKQKAAAYGVDGVMVGRGAFGNPWFFNPQYYNNQMRVTRRSLGEGGFIQSRDGTGVSVKEKLKAMVEHAKVFEKTFAGNKNFAAMRKHFKAYCSGFAGAAGLRAKLMEAESSDETEEIVKNFLKTARTF